MLVPVKNLPNGPNRNSILRYMGDSGNLDNEDKETIKFSPAALAIDNASEIAKRLLEPLFEDISNQIIRECNCNIPNKYSIQCKVDEKLDSPRSKYELLHLGKRFKGIGHYIGAYVNHNIGRITVKDSMGLSGGERDEMMKLLRKTYPTYKITDESNKIGTQPTGGFYAENKNKLKKAYYNYLGINTETIHPLHLEQLYILQQMDELSQHHFCYIESFLYLCHKVLGTTLGPQDPRKRIIFIKRVIWGLIVKFHDKIKDSLDVSREVISYFGDVFPHFIKFSLPNGNNIPLEAGYFQVPPGISYGVKARRTSPFTYNGNPQSQLYTWKVLKIPMPEVNVNSTLIDIIRLSDF
jgi:hypothetical protein